MEQEKFERKKPKIFRDKRGREMVSMAFRCPLAIWEKLETDAIKTGGDHTKSMIRILQKHFNIK